MAKENLNPFLFRYPPNCRFIDGAFKNQIEFKLKPEEFGDSITDKESYRLNLSSARGAISSLNPSQNKGWFMFEDGKYDIHKDFSTILRKDLSIVDIDRMNEILKKELETADKTLSKDIESQLKALEDKKKEVTENVTVNPSPSQVKE